MIFFLCFSNSVKSDDSERSLHRVKDEPQLKNAQRESLLKPQFRKPASQAVGKIQKKRPGKTPIAGTSRPSEGKNGDKNKFQTITHSRMNLLRALSNVKNGQDVKQEFFRGDYDDNARYVRSDEDCSDKSSSYDGNELTEGGSDPLKVSSRKPNGCHSEESSDGDYMKKYPNLPYEPPSKTDYNQEDFLSIFKLITPQVFESLKLRRSERKRRKCAKNEKNDYHYGNFDLNEVSVIRC